MSLEIKFWGTRGSAPSPYQPKELELKIKKVLSLFAEASNANIDKFLGSLLPENFGGFGGNTMCIEVKSPKTRLIIDAGSGLRILGYDLMKTELGNGEGTQHILFTHFHWDHLLGLPFFVPLFIPGNKIFAHAVQSDIHEIFKMLFKKPYFPIPYEKLGAQIETLRLLERKKNLFEDIEVTPYQLDHPDPCWGFKFECGGKSISYCVDTEAKRISKEELGDDLPLYQNIDALIMDAQYTLSESVEKIDWGHASAAAGLDIAMREGIPMVYFVHHDPAASDEKIAKARYETERYYKSQLKQAKRTGLAIHKVEWTFMVEGNSFCI